MLIEGTVVTMAERLRVIAPLMLLLCGLGGIAAPSFLPAAGERVAVIAPGAEALRLVAAAGGQVLTTTDTGIIAVSNDSEFVRRLYHSGAWLVLRFDGLLGCLKSEPEDSDNERG